MTLFNYLNIPYYRDIISHMSAETSHEGAYSFCWSCGAKLAPGQKCPNPECGGAPVVEVKPPKTVLPFCGQNESFNTELYNKDPREYAIHGSPNPSNIEMRYCCKCGEGWMCDQKTWINGTCPHCGAHGPTGDGSKLGNGLEKKQFIPSQIENNVSERDLQIPQIAYSKEFYRLKGEQLEKIIIKKGLTEKDASRFYSDLYGQSGSSIHIEITPELMESLKGFAQKMKDNGYHFFQESY